MGKNVLVISTAETFTIKGLEVKLKSVGAEASYSAPKIKDIENRIEASELVILYTDETVDEITDTLVYLKDYCTGHDEQLIVVGTKAEYEVVEKFIPGSCVYGFFERPLDMNKLLDSVERYLDDDAAHARRKSILIVDDDVSYMSVIMDWLKDSYRVAMANSGIQAITWLAKNHADLILLDYEMPVTSGPQVLEMLKSEAATESIPVMFLTGKNDKESIMRVLALKPVDYLLKTIDKKGLCDKLDNFFLAQAAKSL